MKVLANLRQKGFAQPVLIVTARDQIRNGWSAWTQARTTSSSSRSTSKSSRAARAAARRFNGRPQPVITHGDVLIDPAASVCYEGRQGSAANRANTPCSSTCSRIEAASSRGISSKRRCTTGMRRSRATPSKSTSIICAAEVRQESDSHRAWPWISSPSSTSSRTAEATRNGSLRVPVAHPAARSHGRPCG